MVEHTAVNRGVVGSSPTRGVCGSAGIGRQARLRILWVYSRVGSSPISRSHIGLQAVHLNKAFTVIMIVKALFLFADIKKIKINGTIIEIYIFFNVVLFFSCTI